MSTVFSKIIDRQLPGRIIWEDEQVVAFFTIEPLAYGHTLLVPRAEIDHWVDLPQELATHLFAVAQKISQGLDKAFAPQRVGFMIAGFDVPHTHLHLWPANSQAEFSFEAVNRAPEADKMDDAADKLRAALTELGYGDFVAS